MVFGIFFTPLNVWGGGVVCLEECGLVSTSYIIEVNWLSRYICLKIPSDSRYCPEQGPKHVVSLK